MTRNLFKRGIAVVILLFLLSACADVDKAAQKAKKFEYDAAADNATNSNDGPRPGRKRQKETENNDTNSRPIPAPTPPSQQPISVPDGYERGYEAGVEDGKSESYGLALDEDLAGHTDPDFIADFRRGYEDGWNDYMGGVIEEQREDEY